MDPPVRSLWRPGVPYQQHISNITAAEGSRVFAGIQIQSDSRSLIDKLAPAKGATHRSYVEEEDVCCLRGTRTDMLARILGWTEDPHGKCIFWLCGMAGTGKSTISRTIAHILEERLRLGASFFFKRGYGDRGGAGRFFPTIAVQLADKIPALKDPMLKALDDDSLLPESSLQRQFDKLIRDPLLRLESDEQTSMGVILVIDALDECARGPDIRSIIEHLAELGRINTIRIRIFVTSRPQLPIDLGFRRLDGSVHEDVILEEVQVLTIRGDIKTYLTHRLEQVKEEANALMPYEPLPGSWPDHKYLEELASLSAPLFIFAVTICRYISQGNPRKRLDAVLQHGNTPYLSGLAEIYLVILRQLLCDREDDQRDAMIVKFRNLVGPIVVVAEPLSAQSLSELLAIPLDDDIYELLRHLRSVLKVPSDPFNPIHPLHLSFRDFIVDPRHRNKHEFWIDEQKTHATIAIHCLRILSGSRGLRRDICNVRHPGSRRAETAEARISRYITADIAYACKYWPSHVMQATAELFDPISVYRFLQTHLLHWLEALSWLGHINTAISSVKDLLLHVTIRRNSQFLAFLVDADRFIVHNRFVLDLAPLQVYHSALIFSPMKSIVKNRFRAHAGQILTIPPKMQSNWGKQHLKIEGLREPVHALDFSADGRTIATASSNVIRLWDVQTGEESSAIDTGHDVSSLAFSPSQPLPLSAAAAPLTLAAGSYQGHISLWNTVNADRLGTMKIPEESISALAFSPFPRRRVLSSASGYFDIRLWNLLTLQQIWAFDIREDSPSTSPEDLGAPTPVPWSWSAPWPSSCRLAFVLHEGREAVLCISSRCASRLLSCETGSELLDSGGRQALFLDLFRSDLEGADFFVSQNASGPLIASFSQQKDGDMIFLYHGFKRSTQIKTEFETVSRVAVSSDLSSLALALTDGTVRIVGRSIWEDMHDGRMWVNRPDFLVFSPDKCKFAVASNRQDDGHMIQVWDLVRGELLWNLSRHHYVTSMVVSPDGRMIAAGSDLGHLSAWITTTGEETWTFNGTHAIRALAISKNNHMIASAHSDGEIILSTASFVRKVAGKKEYVSDLAFSVDGQFIAATYDDGTAKMWNISSGRIQCIYTRSVPVGQLQASNYVVCTDDRIFPMNLPVYERASIKTQDTASLTVGKSEWIQRHGQDILWLPVEYRRLHSVVSGDMVFLFGRTGDMMMFKFNLSNIDTLVTESNQPQ